MTSLAPTGFMPDSISWQHRFVDTADRTDVTHSTLIPTNLKMVDVVPSMRSTHGTVRGQTIDRTERGAMNDWESIRRMALMDALAGADLLAHARVVDRHSEPRAGTGRLTFYGPSDDTGARERYSIAASTVQRKLNPVYSQLQQYLAAAGLE